MQHANMAAAKTDVSFDSAVTWYISKSHYLWPSRASLLKTTFFTFI